MKTRITELLKIQYPIVLSGMSWISTPELVAAVSNAGGLGILATGVLTAEQTREAVQKIRSLTKKPFGANVTLYFPGAERNAQVLIEEKVPIINYSLGKGDKIAKAAHAYGGKVVATVTTHKHAFAAQRDGADALIVTGYEAAGHGGAITSLVLIPAIADALDIPIIAAGGFADGRGLLAALALGADGIAMGTRFMNTKESPAAEQAKQASVKNDVYNTVYTPKVDGLPARFMKSEGVERLLKKRLNPFSALIRSKKIADMLEFPWLKLAIGIMLMGPKRSMQMAQMAIGFDAFKLGTIDGDFAKGVLPLGQVSGIIKDTPTVKQVVDSIVKEAVAIEKQLSKKVK
jgi:enoyl-[acyl-carrier protein] reductase II